MGQAVYFNTRDGSTHCTLRSPCSRRSGPRNIPMHALALLFASNAGVEPNAAGMANA
jgi:hypothetical protein